MGSENSKAVGVCPLELSQYSYTSPVKWFSPRTTINRATNWLSDNMTEIEANLVVLNEQPSSKHAWSDTLHTLMHGKIDCRVNWRPVYLFASHTCTFGAELRPTVLVGLPKIRQLWHYNIQSPKQKIYMPFESDVRKLICCFRVDRYFTFGLPVSEFVCYYSVRQYLGA